MTFRASESFWRNFYALSSAQKESARRAWNVFKVDPFDSRLRTHKIHKLSAALGKTVYAVEVERDLRVLFYMDRDVVRTIDIGTHDVYRGI
jgi:hypothetical protein